MQDKANLEIFLKELEELLNEIRKEQIKIGKNVDEYHKVNMRNFDRLKIFNEICDMTNQIFERRICNIEEALKELIKKQ